jgi:transposase-like protein
MGRFFSREQVRAFIKENNIQSGKDLQDAFKELFKDFFHESFEAELEEELGYSKYDWRNKKTGTNSRNGYSTKKVITESSGKIDLQVPRDREGKYEPKIIKKHQNDISSIEDKILSMYAKGMSTTAINSHIKDIYGFNISAEQVSRVTDKIIPLVKEWQNRPLESIYPIIFLDGMVFDVKQEGTYVKKTAYAVLGINMKGIKEVLGIWLGEAESSKFWLSVLSELKSRGVNDIFICSIDGLNGFDNAIKSVYPNTDIQRCVVHQIRNSAKYVTHADKKQFCNDMKPIYKAINKDIGFEALEEFSKKWNEKYPYSVQSWYRNWDSLATFFKYPAEIRRIIYTTNAIESYNNGVKRITKTKTCFNSEDSLLKLVYLVTQDISKKWSTSIHNWGLIYNQILVFFEDRIPENFS